jgi:hypothetical protein
MIPTLLDLSWLTLNVDIAPWRYVAQLEHRVSQIEDFIRSLREGRTEITATTVAKPLHEETVSYRHHGQSTSSTEQQFSPIDLPSSSAVKPSESETSELDNSEDVIDGMAAVQFQNEQDSGFFGRATTFYIRSSCYNM